MQIRAMTKNDTKQVIEMMRSFYRSPSVHTNGSEEIFARDVQNCITPNPYVEGYVFEEEGKLLGYAMVAKSFSTEFGKPCIWLEDLYIQEAARGTGLGSRFLAFLSEKYNDCVLRLEVEEENEPAVRVYQKSGFETLPYMEMIKF